MAAVRKPVRMLWAVLSVLVLGIGSASASPPSPLPLTLRLARLDGVPDQWIGGEILKVAYSRLGIQVQFVAVPALRSLLESSEGRIDGEVQRILNVETLYPTLIAIRPSINFIEPTAFVKKVDFKVQGWPSIAPYQVGIVRGVGSSEAGTRGMSRVTAVPSMEALMRMLAAERLDVAVNDRLSGVLILHQLGLDSEVHPLDPPLQRILLYHFLHVKHLDLVPRVEEALRGIAASGELEQIRLRAVKTLAEEYGVTRVP